MILPDARHFCTVVLGISVLSNKHYHHNQVMSNPSSKLKSLKGESKIKITKRNFIIPTKRNFIPTDLHLQHDLIYSFMR